MQNNEIKNGNEVAKDGNKKNSAGKLQKSQTWPGEKKKESVKQCIGNLNALYKVQGALLSQIERDLE